MLAIPFWRRKENNGKKLGEKAEEKMKKIGTISTTGYTLDLGVMNFLEKSL